MTTREDLRQGWCPGALRPMQTGDGLLVRVRPRAGVFTLDALAEIAEAASRFGSGEIDVTNRANLQLRGLSDETYADALVALAAADLIDRDASAEAVRNVVVDPLSGIDPNRVDMRPLAAELERLLTERRELHALPGKFGFRLLGRDELIESQTAADITVSARDPRRYVIRLDGCDAAAVVVDADHVVAALSSLAAAFLVIASRHPSVRRMRDAWAVAARSKIFRLAGFEATEGRAPVMPCAGVPVGPLGPEAAPFAFGIGLPFGRISAQALLALCQSASSAGCSEVRPSPSRTLVFPVDGARAAGALRSCAQDLGLITLSSDARLAIDVCPGAPACRNATTSTRDDAERLIAALAAAGHRVPAIHISGCQKGCARRTPADVTFVARNGAYDLMRNSPVDGPITVSRIAPVDLAIVTQRALAEPLP